MSSSAGWLGPEDPVLGPGPADWAIYIAVVLVLALAIVPNPAALVMGDLVAAVGRVSCAGGPDVVVVVVEWVEGIAASAVLVAGAYGPVEGYPWVGSDPFGGLAAV